jgi:hypothetical protein
MTSRITLASLGAIVVAMGTSAIAQVGPLKDPIPAPIPQSNIVVTLKTVASGLGAPIFLTVNGEQNSRKYIIDQTGLVLILRKGQIQATPFLDVRSVIAQINPAFPSAPHGLNPGYDERGLLGLAFHPAFHDKESPGYHKLYTLYNVPITRIADFPEPPFPNSSVVPNCQEIIAEWQISDVNPDVVDPASFRELLRFDRPEFNHNGGTLAFGPDQLFYAAFGDGGAANDVGNGHIPGTGNAQNLSTILGKMIRINPVNPSLNDDEDGALAQTASTGSRDTTRSS